MHSPEHGPPTQDMPHSPANPAGPMFVPQMAQPYQAAAPVHHYSRGLPWLEFFLGLFGFHGLTFFALGKPVRGMMWLAFDLIKHAIGGTLIALTFFLALICLIPLDIGISIFMGIHISRTIHQLEHPHLARHHTT